MRVAEIMTRSPMTVEPHEKVGAAVRLMGEQEIRHLPVVDGDQLVGIVSERDLRAHRPPAKVALDHLDVAMDLLDMPVSEVMSADVLTVSSEGSIAEAVNLVLRHRVGSLCVTDGQGRLVGILSYLDLLRVLRPES